jgi:tRNA 2-selenouridine synthase
MAIILSQIGWRTAVLKGGYRTYRRRVQGRLYEDDLHLKLVLLDGETGCGKTAILGELASRGIQALDLEALAQHRGSLFGGYPGRTQPSQKLFESRLLWQLERLDPERPVLVEAESSKVGARSLPPALWRAMLNAPRIEVAAPRSERARYLVRAYADIAQDREMLDRVLARLPQRPGKKRLEEWTRLADEGDITGLAEAMIALHYDPAYARSRRLPQRRSLGRIDLVSVGEADRAQAADAIVHILKETFGRV